MRWRAADDNKEGTAKLSSQGMLGEFSLLELKSSKIRLTSHRRA